MRIAAATCLALALSGCTAMRPEPVSCGIDYYSANGPDRAMMANAEETMTQVFRGAVETREGPLEIQLLALSAGGQFGAFGAGFLRGWSENPNTPRPDFDLVTGVSAGAAMAPVVFAGSEFDTALEGYRGLGQDDVFNRRPLFALPTAPSFANVAPLQSFIETRLSDNLIDEVARRHNEGKGLLILATDLDSTRAAIFDLGEMAASDRATEEKRSCMAEAMLASSAIPGLFPPRYIDGTLFADGGLRDQIFLRTVEDVRQNVARSTNRQVRVSATLVVNGALREPEANVDDGLLAYARRGALVLADEVLRDSIEEVVRFAEAQPNWRLRGIIADTDLSTCDASTESGTFDACVTETLFDDGRAKGRSSPLPWLSPDDLLARAGEL